MMNKRAICKESLVNALAAYRRPGTPVYAYHFRNLPKEVLQQKNAAALRAIRQDDSLPRPGRDLRPARVREHAAEALGELRDPRAVGMLIEALDDAKLRRVRDGAASLILNLPPTQAILNSRQGRPAIPPLVPHARQLRDPSPRVP